MTWINEHKRIWRTAALLLLVVAFIGPWAFDRINVPAEYPCSLPNERLEGDFCGIPLSGIWIFAAVIGLFGSSTAALITGARAFTDAGRELLFSLRLLLLFLPIFTTLFLNLRGERWQMFHVVACGLATAIGLFLGLSGFASSAPPPKLWGLWLYFGVVASVLILELLGLVASKSAVQASLG